jgi:hypothetical protein
VPKNPKAIKMEIGKNSIEVIIKKNCKNFIEVL